MLTTDATNVKWKTRQKNSQAASASGFNISQNLEVAAGRTRRVNVYVPGVDSLQNLAIQ